jgi:DNA-binding NtrC family response regulator
MVVDDEEKVLTALSRILRKEKYSFLMAASGAEALALMAKQPVDVVVSDQRMPGMTGIELLQGVKARYPDTIRMVLTGHADLDVAVAAINEGEVYRFITKPVQAEELKLAIRHALVYHDLLSDNKRLLREVRARDVMLEELEKRYPGITNKRVSQGAFVIEEDGPSLDELIVKYFPPQKRI